MRTEFANIIAQRLSENPRSVFLTGDLGYQALERVASALGDRFINAGVAEQNMVSVAAGLAAQGFSPWVYSIASFLTLRAYEQIRNDICLHRLPVKLVGNGGGFGYGMMGPTHHALQDIGLMRMLHGMKVLVPLFSSDVAEAVDWMMADPGPCYLRLNSAFASLAKKDPFAMWRQLTRGDRLVVISLGPVLDGLLETVDDELFQGMEIWSVGMFPLGPLPPMLKKKIESVRRLVTVEEHCRAGGLGEAVSLSLMESSSVPIVFKSISAQGYPSEAYGSQKWHWNETGLMGRSLERLLRELMDHAEPRNIDPESGRSDCDLRSWRICGNKSVADHSDVPR